MPLLISKYYRSLYTDATPKKLVSEMLKILKFSNSAESEIGLQLIIVKCIIGKVML